MQTMFRKMYQLLQVWNEEHWKEEEHLCILQMHIAIIMLI